MKKVKKASCKRCTKVLDNPEKWMKWCDFKVYEQNKELQKRLDEKDKEIERLNNAWEQDSFRLAGCLCIAEGHNDVTVKQGVYGWSLPYERIRELREKYERLKAIVEGDK